MYFDTYEDYCNERTNRGYQVMPQTLWEDLKSDNEDEDEGLLFDCEA